MSKYVPRDYQLECLEKVQQGWNNYWSQLVVVATGGGKCLGKGTPVLLFDGTIKPVEEITTEDTLIGPDSGPRKILSLAHGKEMMYRINPVKGDSYTVNESHILSLKMTGLGEGRYGFSSGQIVNISVKDYLRENRTFKHITKGWRSSVDWPEKPVVVDPYFLGLWLGDGTKRETAVSKPDPEVAQTVASVAKEWGLHFRERLQEGKCPSYAAVCDQGKRENRLLDAMRLLGVINNPHVPLLYKRNSRRVRLEILAGLIDSDGCLGNSGFDFISRDKILSDDVAFLARSLGLAAYIVPCHKKCQTGKWGLYYRVSISGDCSIVPNRIPRKKAAPRRQIKNVLLTGISVEPIGCDDYYGFTIDGDSLFLLGDFTVTHNTEIYLKAAERHLEDFPEDRVLVLAHREELIFQPADRWRRDTGRPPTLEMGKFRDEGFGGLFDANADAQDRRLVVATVQTLNSGRRCHHCTADCAICGRKGKVEVDCKDCPGDDCRRCKGEGKIKVTCRPCKGDGWIVTEANCGRCFEHFCRRMQKFSDSRFGLVIIDEAHHSPADTYARAVRYFRYKNPRLRLLGLTATPDRADETSLGQVYQNIPFEYPLPRPIDDGWLVPIDQRLVVVEGLNLVNVRTTAGDLNEGDLEREMLLERVLHGVTTPTLEIACGMPEGTVDRLISDGQLSRLQDYCTQRQPTLVHATSVAHAERMNEIFNRYIPQSSICIVGTTHRDTRRQLLDEYSRGTYQFLLSCGVFLEGTDLPDVGVVAVARPTKSRALYAQAAGRGLRPISGLVDGVDDPMERRRLIAESKKPRATIIDFFGNSGRHKLVCAIDILGGGFEESIVESVRHKAVSSQNSVDVLRELRRLREDKEAAEREVARQKAEKRKEDEARLIREAEEKRRGIVAGACYRTEEVSPFDILDVVPEREPGHVKGKMPTERMLKILDKHGIPVPHDATYWDANLLIEGIMERQRKGLGSYRQVTLLKKWGFTDADSYPFIKCQRLIDARTNPKAFRAELLSEISSCYNEGILNRVACKLRDAKEALQLGCYNEIAEAGLRKRMELRGQI